jgi:hypothetical protein
LDTLCFTQLTHIAHVNVEMAKTGWASHTESPTMSLDWLLLWFFSASCWRARSRRELLVHRIFISMAVLLIHAHARNS